MNNLYSDKVLEHFKNPRNLGKIKNPDGIGRVGNPMCGDIMKVYIKVKAQMAKGKRKEYIEDIKVETLGCGAAIATSSIATEMVKGKTLAEAEKLTREDVAKELGGLPPIKMHCSNMAVEGIKKAIADYHRKKYNKNKDKSEARNPKHETTKQIRIFKFQMFKLF